MIAFILKKRRLRKVGVFKNGGDPAVKIQRQKSVNLTKVTILL